MTKCYRIWYNGIDGKYDKRERDIISLSALLVMDKKSGELKEDIFEDFNFRIADKQKLGIIGVSRKW